MPNGLVGCSPEAGDFDYLGQNATMNDEGIYNESMLKIAALTAELEKLRQEHRDLDAAISALQAVGSLDQLQMQRLKKRKLFLRDRLAMIEDEATPDIIA